MHAHADFKSRLLDMASLDTPTRRVVWVGYALLLGIAASAAVRDFLPGPLVQVDPGYRVPLGSIVIAGAGLCATLILLLSGSSLARSRWRYAEIPVLFLMSFALLLAGFRQSLIADLAALFFFIATAALLIFGHALAWRRVVILAAATIALVAALVLLETITGRHTYAATMVFWILAVFAVIVTPVLIVVGWDFAEIASDVVASVLKHDAVTLNSSIYVPALLSAAAVAMAVWLGVVLAHTSPLTLVLRAGALAALGSAFVWACMRAPVAAHGQSAGLRYLLMLAIAVVLVAGGWLATIFKIDVPGVFNYSAGRDFSVMVPHDWRLASGSFDPAQGRPTYQEPIKLVFSPKDSSMPRAIVAAYPRDLDSVPLPAHVTDIDGGGLFDPIPFRFDPTKDCLCGEAVAKHKSTNTEFHFTYRLREVKTTTPASNVNWYLILVAPKGVDAKLIAEGTQILDSFHLRQRRTADPNVEIFTNEIVWMLLGALAVVLGTLDPRRRAVWDFLVWVSIVLVVRNFGVAGQHFHNMEAANAAELSAGILAAGLIAAAGVLVGGAVMTRRTASAQMQALRANAVSFLSALLVLSLIFALYVYAAKGSEYSHAIRGTVICLALTWEFWTSGSMITNHDSTAFPRRARILFFLGYIALIATIVFFFVKMEFTAVGTEQSGFESEIYVAAGMASLGLPFLIFRYVGTLLAAWRVPLSATPS